MRFLLLAAACFLLSACVPYLVSDTPSVQGQVVDAHTHRPVAGACVSFSNHNAAGTVTDPQGRFFLAEGRKLGFVLLFPHNVPGLPVMEVRSAHYQPLRTRVLSGSSDRSQPAVFALQPLP